MVSEILRTEAGPRGESENVDILIKVKQVTYSGLQWYTYILSCIDTSFVH